MDLSMTLTDLDFKEDEINQHLVGLGIRVKALTVIENMLAKTTIHQSTHTACTQVKRFSVDVRAVNCAVEGICLVLEPSPLTDHAPSNVDEVGACPVPREEPATGALANIAACLSELFEMLNSYLEITVRDIEVRFDVPPSGVYVPPSASLRISEFIFKDDLEGGTVPLEQRKCITLGSFRVLLREEVLLESAHKVAISVRMRPGEKGIEDSAATTSVVCFFENATLSARSSQITDLSGLSRAIAALQSLPPEGELALSSSGSGSSNSGGGGANTDDDAFFDCLEGSALRRALEGEQSFARGAGAGVGNLPAAAFTAPVLPDTAAPAATNVLKGEVHFVGGLRLAFEDDLGAGQALALRLADAKVLGSWSAQAGAAGEFSTCEVELSATAARGAGQTRLLLASSGAGLGGALDAPPALRLSAELSIGAGGAGGLGGAAAGALAARCELERLEANLDLAGWAGAGRAAQLIAATFDDGPAAPAQAAPPAPAWAASLEVRALVVTAPLGHGLGPHGTHARAATLVEAGERWDSATLCFILCCSCLIPLQCACVRALSLLSISVVFVFVS